MTKNMTDILIETMQEAITDLINDMMSDVMTMKSVSPIEAYIITIEIINKGLQPKTDEYYEYINNCKTLWEY